VGGGGKKARVFNPSTVRTWSHQHHGCYSPYVTSREKWWWQNVPPPPPPPPLLLLYLNTVRCSI
jgi:hypothetical protein